MGLVKPSHHDPRRVEQLSGELLTAGFVGALKGALIGLTTALALRFISPTYRTARTQVKVFYHASWISMGAVFACDKQLIDFEGRVFREEMIKRQRLLDEAADRGIYLEDDKRNLDDGLHRE
ncbi:hypothetical protein WICPIJ_001688 [Wickerhamomyces pijperi]|uniref:Uncharacterized protein n=1 Tax=Wickerhamomyces pijperi TaxID=599730 RepID=A0A9P8QD69_WICPI|nr:hypothetical protein WICPIJ_001688 [Wickerhamomyces pijperi]